MIISNLRNGYVQLCHHVLEHGTEVAPRGQRTREILNATVCLTDPTDALPVGVGRKPNVAIGAGEAIQLIGGFSDPEMMVSIAGSFERFLDGGILEGNYGVRIKHLLPPAVERLNEDPDSRQAVVQVGRMDDYFGTPSRDLPCTKDLHFFVRDGKLVLVTSMRSNDVWLGVAYDFFQFTQLQLSVAKALGLEAGPYYHHADSLHIYERDWDKVHELHLDDHGRREDELMLEGKPEGVGTEVAGFTHRPIERMQERARALWANPDAASIEGVTASEGWYLHYLRDHVRSHRQKRAESSVDAGLVLQSP
jgi:hypothetical protein